MKLRSLVRHLAPWLIAAATCVFVAWSPVGLAQTPPPGVVWAPAVVPGQASAPLPAAPQVDQNGLINARNARVQQLSGFYDRGVQHATEQVTQTQASLLEQFSKVRVELDTARLQASSGDAVQRTNASRALDHANALLTNADARVKQVRTSLTQDVAQTLTSARTIETTEQAQQRTIAGQTMTPATTTSIAAFNLAQQRLQALPSVTDPLIQGLESTIAVQAQDLRQRMATVDHLLKTTTVH